MTLEEKERLEAVFRIVTCKPKSGDVFSADDVLLTLQYLLKELETTKESLTRLKKDLGG